MQLRFKDLPNWTLYKMRSGFVYLKVDVKKISPWNGSREYFCLFIPKSGSPTLYPMGPDDQVKPLQDQSITIDKDNVTISGSLIIGIIAYYRGKQKTVYLPPTKMHLK